MVASSRPAARLTGLVAALLDPLIPGPELEAEEAPTEMRSGHKETFSTYNGQLDKVNFNEVTYGLILTCNSHPILRGCYEVDNTPQPTGGHFNI